MISSLGRVKALARVIYTRSAPNGRWLKEKILSQWVSKQKNQHTGDYTYELVVTYQFEGARVTAVVRRLVYEAFVQPKTKQKITDKLVYPLDGNGLNCEAGNLGLATRTELRIKELQNERYVIPVYLLPKEYYLKLAKAAGRSRRKKVNKYKPRGRLVASYPSLTAAAMKNNTSVGCIGLCVQKKVKLLKGFVYRYADEGYAGELRDWQGTEKKIIQYSVAGKKLAAYKSIAEAAKLLNIEAGTISRTAKKRSKHAGGFVWRYAGDLYRGEYKDQLQKRKFAQYNPDGKKLAVYDSISLAARQTKSRYEGIRLALQGKGKSSNGYLWKWISNE